MVQAIPVYVMSFFLIPQKVCDQIEWAAYRFCWGSKEDQKKIHWVSKKKLFRTKLSGCMGFKSLKDFNNAMLAMRRMHANPQSLLARRFKARCFPNVDIY